MLSEQSKFGLDKFEKVWYNTHTSRLPVTYMSQALRQAMPTMPVLPAFYLVVTVLLEQGFGETYEYRVSGQAFMSWCMLDEVVRKDGRQDFESTSQAIAWLYAGAMPSLAELLKHETPHTGAIGLSTRCSS